MKKSHFYWNAAGCVSLTANSSYISRSANSGYIGSVIDGRWALFGVGRSDLLVWTQVRRHTWFLWLRWGPWGREWSPRFPTSRRRSANNAAGLRDLASGGRLNGSEQTAGAGEQTQQPHQKAKRPWTDEVRRPGQIPKTRNAAERPRNQTKKTPEIWGWWWCVTVSFIDTWTLTNLI